MSSQENKKGKQNPTVGVSKPSPSSSAKFKPSATELKKRKEMEEVATQVLAEIEEDSPTEESDQELDIADPSKEPNAEMILPDGERIEFRFRLSNQINKVKEFDASINQSKVLVPAAFLVEAVSLLSDIKPILTWSIPLLKIGPRIDANIVNLNQLVSKSNVNKRRKTEVKSKEKEDVSGEGVNNDVGKD